MDESKWERYGALGGVVFVVLVIASLIAAGGTAMASDPADKILKYYRDNEDGLKVASYLGILAAVPIIWWAGSLWARLRRFGDRHDRLAVIAILGLLIAGAGNLTQTGVNAAVALDLDHVRADSAKFFFLLSQAFGGAGLVGIAVLVLAVSIATFRLGAFPRWVGWLGVVDGLAFLVGAAVIATTSDAINTFAFVGLILWAVWMVATSIVMYRGSTPLMVEELVVTETIVTS
jgi:hypothetical protein